MFTNRVLLGQGFIMEAIKTSVIDHSRIREKEGKLTKDLGEPAMQATEKELQRYIDSSKSESDRKKRQARVNLMKAHKKGHEAQHHKLAESKAIIARQPIVVAKKHNHR